MREVLIDKLPHCDFCIGSPLKQRNTDADSPEPVRYDGPTIYGSWAYMCPRHFASACISPELSTKMTLSRVITAKGENDATENQA